MGGSNAVVYCDGSFQSTYGKTAHGLVRFTTRYRVICVIDSGLDGRDSGLVLDGRENGIPLVGDVEAAVRYAASKGLILTHFVVGVATDGGTADTSLIDAAKRALENGLNIDSGLHDFLSDVPELQSEAAARGLTIRDIRKPASSGHHTFTGRISTLPTGRIAVLGTDSAVGKRTTAWKIVQALRESGRTAEMIGTGQTAWMQGARFGIILDSLLNDFISGELEHAVLSAWEETGMDVAVIEGQGSLMNPGYPGGYEIIAAARPQGIIMQHAPARKEYDGFPGYPIDSLTDQIHIAEFLSKRKVLAVTINHEGIPGRELDAVCEQLEDQLRIPVVDPLIHGVARLLPVITGLDAG